MKKKIILFLLCSLLLTGCSNRGVDLSANARKIGETILSTTDSFLNGVTSASTAANLIGEHCNQLNSESIPEQNSDSLLKSACEVLSYTLIEYANAENPNLEDVINARNKVASLMGEKDR